MAKKCKHPYAKERISAKEIEVTCSECNELIYTRTRVLSSNIFSIGRNGRDTIVQFMTGNGRPGAMYEVQDYPKSKHDEFMAAASKGQYYAANIRHNKKYKVVEV